MDDLEARIQALIDGKREPKTTGVRVPTIFREKILAAAKQKFGGLDQERIFSATLLYFAARGLLLWDDANQQPLKLGRSSVERPGKKASAPKSLRDSKGLRKTGTDQ